MLYHKLLQPTGQLQALLEQQHCSISPEISSSALGGARGSREGSPGSCGTPAGLYADLFKWYDRNKSGAIEQDELQVRVHGSANLLPALAVPHRYLGGRLESGCCGCTSAAGGGQAVM
jgi:hypothetical protein